MAGPMPDAGERRQPLADADCVGLDPLLSSGWEGAKIIASSHRRRALTRRSFLSRVAGGSALAIGAGALVTGCKSPEGKVAKTGGLTDCDQEPNADPAGSGRTGGSSGISDTDGGPNADPAGCGRGGGPVTDSDRGRHADPVGEGRGPDRHTDRDMGFGADPIGRGKGEGSAK